MTASVKSGRFALRGLAMASGTVLLAACSSSVPSSLGQQSSPGQSVSPAPSVAGAGVPASWAGVTDPKKIPLGDDKVSTAAQTGHVYSCQTSFRPGGARHDGPWMDTANKTWDSTSKVQVQGEHSWPDAEYDETVQGDSRVITSKDLPTHQSTGTFPVQQSDPAYQYDTNPNAIASKTVNLTLPLDPSLADSAGCLSMGAIGILKNGVYLYNALDDAGRDAAAHETQDMCDGHPDGAEDYHYHDIPSCLLSATTEKGSTLVGYALDGFGIYVERDDKGNLPTNADLDGCHGRTSKVMWNGKETTMYHYSATLEFPYTVGCYHGTPIETPAHDRTEGNRRGAGQGRGQGAGQGAGPAHPGDGW
ncbi:YHYH protein [Streptomyces actuosus]|uniref:YHYH protein n=1 Tax=Streptomyces actuosus TaxID=1885 RepID=A0ABS2W0H5_STRAS|nr:YHYH protein [Streptomyces actuosus]MBN0048902.1 YHYH protein [Streptomyces actuosus]